MPEPLPLSRRAFLSAGATLLASAGAGLARPGTPARAAETGRANEVAGASTTDLALFRPVTASSTDYAPTPAAFAVDGLPAPGVRGSGWRAAPGGDPQWISVDLEAPCQVEAVTLTFEATAADPAFDGNYGETDGAEIRSSAATAYAIEVSIDGATWTRAHDETAGAGGVQAIRFAQPVTARWVRLTVTARSNANPAGLNGFQVYGTPPGRRPRRTGWTDWAGRNTRPAPALTVAADGTVPIESGWSLTLDDFVPAAPTGADVDTRDWLPATVPGTVLTTLVDQGHLPDPVRGFANLHIPEALSRHSWWYRRELRLPKGFDASRTVRLEFDGVNHQATAWVNGVEVGTLTHPFARAAFDITAALRGRTEHVLAVRVTPMPHPGTPGDKGPDGNTFVQSGHLHLDSPTYLAASGWDWMPAVRDRVAGIWDHVRLRATGVAVIGDPHIVTKVPGTGTATVTVAVPVRNAGDSPAGVTVQASFDKTRLSRTVTIAPGQAETVTFDPVTVRKPRLWWPNGYGDPNLYDLTLTATVAGRPSDERATRFGIREFTYDWDAPVVISPPPQPPLVFDGNTARQTVTFDRRTARYVRIQGGRRATEWGISMWALSIVDSRTGTDLALHQPVTASGDDGSPAANAVDGNPDSRWSSRYQDNEWIQVDLGADQDFDQVTIAWETAYALDWTIQTGEAPDGPWTDVKRVSNETPVGDTGLQTETFAPQTIRYVRIVGDRRATEWGISLWTLEVHNGDGPDLALHKPATASGDDGNPAGNAVDGNPRTRWSSRYQDGEWLRVDLGDATAFDRIAIAWEQAYARAYRIQVSADGQAWTDVKAVDNSIRQLRISVNGVPVFVRGGNWGWDELLRRVPGHRTAETVAMHRDMNFTMIRNWLGSSNRDDLYRACDENGILVWNDFWEAGGFQPNPPGYLDIAADTIRRFRSHPSIVVWCGANEEFPPPIVDAGLRRAVETEDPEILYVQNSAGWIVSGHGPYRWIDPAAYNDRNSYDTQAFGFHTEIGMPVVPHVETMRNLIGDEPGWPIGPVWNYHDWSERGNQRTDTYRGAIDARLGESATLEQFAARAQFVNYESHRAMFEAWNANLWDDATALLLWMSHPAWYSTVWQTYDYDLDVNGAYYGSRKACEPRHVQADPATWRARAVNHTTAALTGEVTARCYDLSGRRLGATQRARVDVPPSAGRPAFVVTAPAGHPFHLVRLELRDAAGMLLSENTYWRYEKDIDMRALTALARTRLVVSTGKAGGTSLSATVANRGSSVAALVRLAVRDEHGDRVLPARYDDNYFWLLPGESRKVIVSWPARLNGRRGVHLTAEAYNAERVAG